jgi:membrane protein implicated in regulation of membrane protease activity
MESEIRNLSMGQKIALWLAFIWVLFCLLGALGNGWFLVIVVCLALLAAIICLFKNILDAKYAWAVFAVSLIFPFIMIGALADTDDESAKQGTEEAVDKKAVKSEDSKTTKKATEKVEKKKDLQLSPKEKEIADAGYKKGSMFGMAGASNEEFSNMLDLADYVDGMDDKVTEMFEQMAGDEYDKEYHAPTNAEEKKLKKIYIEHFIEAMNGTMDAMDNLEKLGGKRK